jgi:hypothetical protein
MASGQKRLRQLLQQERRFRRVPLGQNKDPQGRLNAPRLYKVLLPHHTIDVICVAENDADNPYHSGQFDDLRSCLQSGSDFHPSTSQIVDASHPVCRQSHAFLQ